LLSEYCLDDESLLGAAVLLRAEGTRMARELVSVVGLRPKEVAPDVPALIQSVEQLRSSGYAIRSDPDFSVIAELRTEYCSCVDALAEHLGKPSTTLVRQI
jgi:hypothetical protein